MVAVGFHGHWLFGIDCMRQSHNKLVMTIYKVYGGQLINCSYFSSSQLSSYLNLLDCKQLI